MKRTKQRPKTALLIIVHPGSACGSADMNLGAELAETARLDMQILVEGWEGAVAVIDGGLSDELVSGRRGWVAWGRAIDEALLRARGKGLLAQRIMGDDATDYDQTDAVRDLVSNHGLAPSNTAITLTGAWIDDQGDGCVNAVREALEALGFAPTIEDAMNLDMELDTDDELSDEDEQVVTKTVRKTANGAKSAKTRPAKPKATTGGKPGR